MWMSVSRREAAITATLAVIVAFVATVAASLLLLVTRSPVVLPIAAACWAHALARWWRLYRDPAVRIDGEVLLLERHAVRVTLPLHQVEAVEQPGLLAGDRVRLRLTRDTPFGRTIWFSPPPRPLSIGANPQAHALRLGVAQAHRRQGARLQQLELSERYDTEPTQLCIPPELIARLLEVAHA